MKASDGLDFPTEALEENETVLEIPDDEGDKSENEEDNVKSEGLSEDVKGSDHSFFYYEFKKLSIAMKSWFSNHRS